MTEKNPLLSGAPRPKFSIVLPSQGDYWPEGALASTDSLSVFSFSGRDETLLRRSNPIYLGSVLAEIITRCIPAIKDVWSMPRCDLDAVLAGLLAASYTPKVTQKHQCPHCESDNQVSINLSDHLTGYQVPDYRRPLNVDDFTVHFQPVSFQDNFQLLSDQTRKEAILEQLRDPKKTQEQKDDLINQTLADITSINIRAIAATVESVVIDENRVTDRAHIIEWLEVTERHVFEEINQHSNNILSEYRLPIKTVTCANCNSDFDIEVDVGVQDYIKTK